MVNRVVVIGGGSSPEASISRTSAREVKKALPTSWKSKYFELDEMIATNLRKFEPDVVFPVLHGTPGEDGSIQGLMQILGFPYVGSDMRASVIAMHKSLAKGCFRSFSIPVLDELIIKAETIEEDVAGVIDTFGTTVVCKAMNAGSALGVVPMPDGGDVMKAARQSLEIDSEVLVEPFVHGREITVGVLDLHEEEPLALPVTEIVVAKDEWYDYENRYTPGQSEHIIPAEIDPDTAKAMQKAAVDAHVSLGCRDYSRIDFILEPSNQFWVLELNNIPGMTPTSLFPDSAKAQGIPMETLVQLLVESAAKRGPDLISL